MGNRWILGWGIIITAGLGAIYGLHRLAQWLEDRGHLYYLRRKPSGGGAPASFIALQQLVEPRTTQVQKVRDEVHHREEEGESGRGGLLKDDLPPPPFPSPP